MEFKQIIEKLIQGKKIRRPCWDNGHYWFMDSQKKGQLKDSIGEHPIISQKQLEALDWETYDEKPKEKLKPMVIILDDNPISIFCYAEEYPENWKKICESLEKK